MAEVWRIIPGFPDYAVSNEGRIKRIIEGSKGHLPKVLRPHVNNQGYRCVTIYAAGKSHRKQISRLVCEAWYGAPPTPEHQAAHGDGDPSNNRPGNLRWATRLENEADKDIHGTRPVGAKHGRYTKPHRNPRGSGHGLSKLTESDVLAIRAAPKVNGSGVRLAAQYGVTPGAICLIRSRKNWRHL